MQRRSRQWIKLARAGGLAAALAGAMVLRHGQQDHEICILRVQQDYASCLEALKFTYRLPPMVVQGLANNCVFYRDLQSQDCSH